MRESDLARLGNPVLQPGSGHAIGRPDLDNPAQSEGPVCLGQSSGPGGLTKVQTEVPGMHVGTYEPGGSGRDSECPIGHFSG